MAKKKIWVPIVAGATALALLGGGFATAQAMHKNDVTLVVDGVSKTIAVREDTVAEVLDLEGLEVGQHDVVLPGPDTQVENEMEISVAYGRQVELTVDGETKNVWTTALSVGEALAFLDLDEADSKLSASRSAAIGRDGLSLDVVTAKDVSVTVAGKATPLTVAGTTVADALAAAGVTADEDDKVEPAADAELTEGLEITYVNVEKKQRTEEVKIPFEKSEVKSSKYEQGTTKVTTKGVNGSKTENWTDTFEDGKLVDSKLDDSKVTKEPVKQVTAIGTKKPAAKTSSSSSSSSSKSSSSSSSSSKSSSSSGDQTPASGSSCKASYYWQPQMTASGEQFNPNAMTAAHKTYKMGTKVKVTNQSNGKTVTVRINDRGPYISGRCLDLSKAAMQAIGGTSAGVINVTYQVVG